MEQENNISIGMSSLNIKSPENSDFDVPANSDSENPSTTIETDKVHTETDLVDNGNCGKGLSFEEPRKHVSSEKDHESDHQIDHSPNEKNIVGSADAQGQDFAAVRHFPKRSSPKSFRSTVSDLNVPQSGSKEKSSRKTDSPIEKKVVGNAEAKGHDTDVVRPFPEHGLPKSSKYAVADSKFPRSRSDEHSSRKAKSESKFKLHTFIPMFTQPGADPQFSRIVWEQKVCLKHVLIVGTTVKGIISVLNLGFQKLIQVFYTTDNWQTRTAVNANFLSSNTNNSIDRFQFVIYPPIMRIRERLVFYIGYRVNGCEFWDNNYTRDYRLDYVAKYLICNIT